MGGGGIPQKLQEEKRTAPRNSTFSREWFDTSRETNWEKRSWDGERFLLLQEPFAGYSRV